MTVLGIETSCDETAASVCRIDGSEAGVVMLSNSVVSQIDIHKAYGGVVPEVAARSHIEAMMPVVDDALKVAFGDITRAEQWAQIDAVAVTYGAGLNGSLLIGVLTARTLATTLNKPLYACNHVEGHVYANFITDTTLAGYSLPATMPQFPVLALIVSGGHSQLVLFRTHFDYTLLGKTYDDAIGEAFDKVAKMTGLPYPGGPSVALAAAHGDSQAFSLPISKIEGDYNFSFSGLKTAVLRRAQMMCGRDYTMHSSELPSTLSEAQVNDIAAVFQRVAIETVVTKTLKAYQQYSPASVVIAGGVAANNELRHQLADALPIAPSYTDVKLCTDNGAMIAALGCYKAVLGVAPTDPYSLEPNPNLKM